MEEGQGGWSQEEKVREGVVGSWELIRSRLCVYCEVHVRRPGGKELGGKVKRVDGKQCSERVKGALSGEEERICCQQKSEDTFDLCSEVLKDQVGVFFPASLAFPIALVSVFVRYSASLVVWLFTCFLSSRPGPVVKATIFCTASKVAPYAARA
jgi:hypothetical protein